MKFIKGNGSGNSNVMVKVNVMQPLKSRKNYCKRAFPFFSRLIKETVFKLFTNYKPNQIMGGLGFPVVYVEFHEKGGPCLIINEFNLVLSSN